MKKFALAMCAVLALSATASAGTATVSNTATVSVSGQAKSVNGSWEVTGTPSWDGLKISMTAAGAGWTGEADLDNMNNVRVKSYKFAAQDGKFNLTVWGGKDLSSKKTPFEWVSSGAAGGNWKARAGYDFLTLDVEEANDNVYLFGEKAIGTLTVGGAYNTAVNGKLATLDGYATTKVGPATVTGEAALQSTDTIKDNNSRLGVKASADLSSAIYVEGQFQNQAKNYGDYNKLYGMVTFKPMTVNGSVTLETKDVSKDSVTKVTTFAADQTKDFTRFAGSMTNTTDKAGKTWKALHAEAIYRGSKDVSDYAYVFDAHTADKPKYWSNTALAAGVYYDNKADNAADKNAATTITVKATSPIIPGKAWVAGAFTTVSDADGNVKIDAPNATLGNTADTKSKTTLDVDARYQMTSKTRLTGELLSYSAGKDSYSSVYGKVGYQMVDALGLWSSLQQESSNKYVKGVQTFMAGFDLTF